jgi:hypothetical protein
MFNRLEFVRYNLFDSLDDECHHKRSFIVQQYQNIPVLSNYQMFGFHTECLKNLPSHINLTWLKYYELAKICLKLTTENIFFNCVNDMNMIEPFISLFPNITWKALYRNKRLNNPIVANPYNIRSVRSQIKRKVDVYICDNISSRSNIYEKYVELITGISLLTNGGTLVMNLPNHGTKWFMMFMKKCKDLFGAVYICRPSITYVGSFMICTGFKGVTQTELDSNFTMIEENKSDMQNDIDNICSSYYFSIIESELIFRITSMLLGLNEHQINNMNYYRTIHNDYRIKSLLKVKANQWVNSILA